MFDGTVETIMFASQAPPSAHLIALSRGDEQQTSHLSQLQVWHERRYPAARETTVKRKQRRDAGVSRVPGPASVGPVAASAAPVTEAAFGRKREAAIADAVASSPSKRARVAPDTNWVRQADDPEPAPTCVCQGRCEACPAAGRQDDGERGGKTGKTSGAIKHSSVIEIRGTRAPCWYSLGSPHRVGCNSQGSSAWVSVDT